VSSSTPAMSRKLLASDPVVDEMLIYVHQGRDLVKSMKAKWGAHVGQ
jgi:hypothetical protein